MHQLGGALGTSFVLAVADSYPAAMLVGAILLLGALVAATALVLPAIPPGNRPARTRGKSGRCLCVRLPAGRLRFSTVPPLPLLRTARRVQR